MRFIVKVIGIVLCLFASLTVEAQNCKAFYKNSRCFVRESAGFQQYGQARSAAVEIGETYKLQAVLYGQKDYIISVCSESGIKPLHFRIVKKDNGEVIYDNADDEYNQYIGFAMEKTQSVVIELTILNEKEDNVDPMTARVCVGVQIVWRKIPKLGFGKDEAGNEEETSSKSKK
jgi:hypothetical protein